MTIEHFKLGKVVRQARPISTCLSILFLEILFIFIESSKKSKGLNFFENIFLYIVYAGDATLFEQYKACKLLA